MEGLEPGVVPLAMRAKAAAAASADFMQSDGHALNDRSSWTRPRRYAMRSGPPKLMDSVKLAPHWRLRTIRTSRTVFPRARFALLP